MTSIEQARHDRRGLAFSDGLAVEALPLALVSLLERRHLDALEPGEWRFQAEAEAGEHVASPQVPHLRRIVSLPRDEVPSDSLAQALCACLDYGHASVFVLDAAPGAVSLHLGVRRTPGQSSGSTADAMDAHAAAFVDNIPGTSLGPSVALTEKAAPDLHSFIDRAPCIAALTGSARPRPPGGRAGFERLIQAAGRGRFALSLVAQALPPAEIDALLDAIRRLRSEVHVYSRRSRSFGTGESKGVSVNNPDRAAIKMDQYPMLALALAMAAQFGASRGGFLSSFAPLAQPLTSFAMLANQRTVSQMRMTGEQHSTSSSTNEGGQIEVIDANAQACEQILLRHEERLLRGRSQGWWRTAAYIAADSQATLRRVQGAMQAMAIGEGPPSEPVRMVHAPKGLLRDAMRGADFVRIEPRSASRTSLDPVARGLAMDSLTTLVTTEELSAMTALPSGEVAGLTRRGQASFAMVAPEATAHAVPLGHVLDGRGEQLLPVSIAPSALNRNTLVTGIVGSGKTTTCKRLLVETHRRFGVPFLVVEPVKSEYRGLLHEAGLANLNVFTIGGDGIPLRLNPLEPVPGFPVGRHIDLLKAVFNAVFPMGGGMSQVLEEALIGTYTERGWSVRRNVDPRVHFDAHGLEGVALMPNLADLLAQIDAVMARKRYSGEVLSNINEALRQRVFGLLLGQKTMLLDARRSTPAEMIFSQPTVIELKTLGDGDEQAFAMALIFVLLAEYAEVRQAALPPSALGRLQHLTLIEEAHRLLSATRSGGAEAADVRYKAVSMFTDLLAELRAYGEGFVVADQIPTKLTPETLKNTAVKITHRLTASDDRQAMAGCMDLREEQARHLNRLSEGQAVLHDPSLGEAVLVAVERLSPPVIGARAAGPRDNEHLRLGCGCEPCPAPCRWRDVVEEERQDLPLASFAGALVDAALASQPLPVPPRRDPGEEPGQRFCAFRAALRTEIESRASARSRWVGLEVLRPGERIAVERSIAALAPMLLPLAAGEEPDAELWVRSSEMFGRALSAAPPREWPGCGQCEVRCVALPAAMTLRPRAEKMAALVTGDQDAGLRAQSYLELSRGLGFPAPDILWCLAVQQAGERAMESKTAEFMAVLSGELLLFDSRR